MPLYYFHLRDGEDLLLDPEGRELEGTEQIATAALKEARCIISDDARQGRIRLDQYIDVEDSKRRVVHRLPFAEALEIRLADGGLL